MAGCSGGAHHSDGGTASLQAVAYAEVSPGATPFGVAQAQAQASPSAAPTAASSVAPVASTGPAAAIAATPAASPSVVAAAAAAPASTAPAILSVHTSPAVIHDGDTLLWTVHTTPDVVDVVAHVTVYAFRLQKHGAGEYVLTFTIPHGVPGFFHGNYTLDLVARNSSGAEASTKVPVAFQ